jgi:hypothetical protein
MQTTKIYVPKNNKADYDYIAFSFRDKHSVEDFGIYRTNNEQAGFRESLTPTLTDKSADQIGQDGQYFFGSQYKDKIITVNFAFDQVNEKRLREIK